jgi:hypothetical protein
MLDRVGHVGVPALDPGLLERFVEEAPCRTHERATLEILMVAGLLADEDEPRALPALAEHRLGRVAPERAGPAVSRGFSERCQRETGRQQVGRGAGFLHKVEIPEFPALHSPSGRPSEKLAEKAWSRNRRQQADRRARPASIVVQSGELRLACRVPEEKQAKLVGLKLGDKVEILCVGGTLAGIQRTQPAEKPSGDEVRI